MPLRKWCSSGIWQKGAILNKEDWDKDIASRFYAIACAESETLISLVQLHFIDTKAARACFHILCFMC